MRIENIKSIGFPDALNIGTPSENLNSNLRQGVL